LITEAALFLAKRKSPATRGFFMHETRTQRSIELKNSSLDLVLFVFGVEVHGRRLAKEAPQGPAGCFHPSSA